MNNPCCLMKIFVIIIFYFEFGNCRKAQRAIVCKGKGRPNSFLWTMQRNPPVHFFGTIHVPYTQVWDYIPDKSKKAFKESENVYFELDLTDPSTISALTRCQMLPGGTDLREVLPPDLYQRLKRHLHYVKSAMPRWLTSEQKGRGLYADMLYDAIVGNWEQKKPIWVMLMINSLTEADVRARGTSVLDLHLARLAQSLGKEVGAVEKVDEQCQPLNGLNLSQVVFALNHTLMMQEQLRHGTVEVPYTTDELIEQYNCGDLDSVMFSKESSQIPQMTNATTETYEKDLLKKENETDMIMATDIDSYFKNELIYRRNQRMAHRVKILLEENPNKSFFFAFGAGHFLGNGSVIDFLQRDGYKFVQDELNSESPGKKTSRHLSKKNARRNRKAKKSNQNSRKRGKGRRQQKKKRGREMKGRQRVRDLWERMENRDSSPETSLYTRGIRSRPGYYSSEHSQPEVRVINRYPTVFPPYLYDDWKSSKNQGNDYAAMESWSYSTNRNSKTERRHHRNTRAKKASLKSDLDVLSYKLWSETYVGDGNAGQTTFSVSLWSLHGLKYFVLTFLTLWLNGVKT